MEKFIEAQLESWEQIFQLNKYFLSSFIFRGHSDYTWALETSIERTISKFEIHSYPKDITTDERWMLHEFKRKAHHYLNHNLDYEDHFEWLAIMQHYGAPTRLLDFTYSLFIASYFAVIDSATDAAIWAINRYTIRDNLVDKKKVEYKKRYILKDEINDIHIKFANSFINRKYSSDYRYPSLVIPLEPKLLNERLSRQQGLFLMPTNPEISFVDNLYAILELKSTLPKSVGFEELVTLSNDHGLNTQVEILKIRIPAELHSNIIRYLSEMNVTAEILFPGLSGLAQSLIQTQVRS